MMRPGIGKNLFTRKDLAGKYLTKEHDKIDDEMKSALLVSLFFSFFKYNHNGPGEKRKKLFFISLGKIRCLISRRMVKPSS